MIVRLAWVLLAVLAAVVVYLEFFDPTSVTTTRVAAGAAPGANLALGRAYTLEPTPNYATPTPVSQGVLTDGKLGRSAHWVSGASHGWNMASPATAEIGLETVSTLNEVRIHATRAPSAGVEWPSVAHLFVSADGNAYRTWLEPGVLVKTGTDGSSFERGYYRFDLKGTTAVRIVVAVFGAPFIFLDEVEAIGTAPATGAPRLDGLGPAFARSDLKAAVRDARIGGLLQPVRARLAAEGRLPAALQDGEPAPWRSRKEGPREASTAAASGSTEAACTAKRIWPWQSFRFEKPALQPMPDAFDGTDVTLAGQPAWFAWQVANPGTTARRLQLRDRAPADAEAFRLAYVPTIKAAIVGDAILPLPDAIDLPAGESVTVMLKLRPASAGTEAVRASFDCGGQALAVEASLKTVADTRAAPPSHFTTWAYPKGPMRKGLECRPRFEAEYGIDTATIGEDALQDLSAPAQLKQLIEQLRLSKGAARVLLFMHIRTHEVFRKGADQGALAIAARRWLSQLQLAVNQSGFDGEVLLYPIDEFEANDIDWYRRAKRALQRAAEEGPIAAAGVGATLVARWRPLRFFGTIAQAKYLGVANDLDVASVAVLVDGLGDRTDVYRHEFYIGEEPAKELSPSRFYFAAPIGAAVRGSPGFGIWAMADSSGVAAHEQAWTDIGIGERDFGMVYFDAAGCPVPTLRLAAVGAGRTAERILRNCWAADPAGAADARQALAVFGRVGDSEGADLGGDALNPLVRELERCTR
ncbi:MAG: hypothetical protein AB7P21_28425 [Lautropia sp.]